MKKKILFIVAMLLIITMCSSFLVSYSAVKAYGELQNFSYSYGSFFGGYYDYTLSTITDDNGNEQIYLRYETSNMAKPEVKAGFVSQSDMKKLNELIHKYRIERWNGFDKYNDGILDGYGFGLRAGYENKTITAQGYERRPLRYNEAHAALLSYFWETMNNMDSILTKEYLIAHTDLTAEDLEGVEVEDFIQYAPISPYDLDDYPVKEWLQNHKEWVAKEKEAEEKRQADLYDTYEKQIEEFGLTITGEHLDEISNIESFFSDLDDFRCRRFLNDFSCTYFYDFDPETGLYTSNHNYAFKPTKGNLEIYIDGALADTIIMMDLKDFYKEKIEAYQLTVTEEQLEKISDTENFFSDLDDFLNWIYKSRYDFDPETGLYTLNQHYGFQNYAFKPINGNLEIYIDGALADTLKMMDLKEIYKEEIEAYQLTVTEEQLRIVGRQFFTDLSYISRQQYSSLHDVKREYFDEPEKQDLRITVNSKEIDNTMGKPCPAYHFEMKNGKWNFYIGNDKVGTMEYVSPLVYFADEIAEYNIHCPEECFFEVNFEHIFYWANTIMNHDLDKEVAPFFTYDEKKDTYGLDKRIPYYYSGDSKGNYDIIYRGNVIGSFTVAEETQ